MWQCLIIKMRYLLMAYCSVCDKAFKTVQSLASHRYAYHKDTKGDTQSDTKSAQSDNESTQSDNESVTQLNYESPKRSRLSKQINKSTQADIESGTDMEYERPKRLSKQININTAVSFPKLVKYLCKFIIEGDLPLTKNHVKMLKPDACVIRQIAHGRVSERQKLIREQVLLHNETGDSALGKLLETAINILQTMF